MQTKTQRMSLNLFSASLLIWHWRWRKRKCKRKRQVWTNRYLILVTDVQRCYHFRYTRISQSVLCDLCTVLGRFEDRWIVVGILYTDGDLCLCLWHPGLTAQCVVRKQLTGLECKSIKSITTILFGQVPDDPSISCERWSRPYNQYSPGR